MNAPLCDGRETPKEAYTRMAERVGWGWWMVVALVIAEGALHEAWAIPAFSRKFDIDCGQCHSVAPALNDFGEAFRTQGFRMAGLVDRLPEEFRDQVKKEDPEDLPPSYWPLSARVIMGYRYESEDHRLTDAGETKVQTRTFGVERFKLMMGGLLSESINFYLTYLPTVTDAALATPDPQVGEVEFAWIRLNDLSVGSSTLKFNVKLGSFELDVPVSRYRRHTLSTYPIYGYFPAGSAAAEDPETTLDWSERQLGAEVSGQTPWWGLRYSLALINGTNGHADSNDALDYYLRVSAPLEDHRIGGVVYWGSAPTEFQLTAGVPIAGTGVGNQTFYRLGVDGSFLVQPPLKLEGLFLYGSDSSGLFNVSERQTATFIGGFLEAQYDLLKEWSSLLVFRYDFIRNLNQGDPSTDPKKGDLDGVTVTGRYRMLETTRLALLFHGEYSHVKTKLTSPDENDQTDNRITAAFDLML